MTLVSIPSDYIISPVVGVLDYLDHNLGAYGLDKLWVATKGKGVKIGYLDTGCDMQHPDLAHIKKYNQTNSPYGADDVNGHGTWIGGIIGANGEKYKGIAPEVEVHSIKVLGDRGTGNIQDIVNGIRLADDLDLDIISMSFGGMGLGDAVKQALQQFIDRRPQRFAFASAGNNGQVASNTMTEPATFNMVYAIGACDWHGVLTPFSSVGPELDFVGPGAEVVSTIPVERGQYGAMSGTSMANPIVAAIAALILAKHREHGGQTPVNTVEEMYEHLKRSCIDRGAPGRDDLYGFGVIDPNKLDLAEPLPPPPAEKPPYLAEVIVSTMLLGSRWMVVRTSEDPKPGDKLELVG